MTITLSQGKVAIIDKVDNTGIKWYYGGNGYACNKNKERMLYLHRYVMERKLKRKMTTKEYVDHKNGNKLDNRRCNLRICTMSQNLANSKLRTDNTSGARGVSLDSRNGHYVAHFYIKSKKTHIGSFKTLEEAVKARRDKEIELYGEFVLRGVSR